MSTRKHEQTKNTTSIKTSSRIFFVPLILKIAPFKLFIAKGFRILQKLYPPGSHVHYEGRGSQLTAPHLLETAKISPAMVRRFAERLRTELQEGNPALRKAYVKLFVSKVVVGRETIHIAGSEAALVGALDNALQGRKIGSHIDGAWRPVGDGNPGLGPSP